jgi:predicted Rossmann-fold nucleotide-binding protein
LGAKAGGGRVETVVLNPKKKMANYEGSNKENDGLANKIIKTKDYPSRLNKLIEIGDAFVIFDGGVGTLSEVGLTWQMAKFEYGKHEPLIFFGEKLEGLVNTLISELKYDPIEKKVYEVALTPGEVLEIIKNRKGIKRSTIMSVVDRLRDWIK